MQRYELEAAEKCPWAMMSADEEGNYVRWDDVEQLTAERDALRARVDEVTRERDEAQSRAAIAEANGSQLRKRVAELEDLCGAQREDIDDDLNSIVERLSAPPARPPHAGDE